MKDSELRDLLERCLAELLGHNSDYDHRTSPEFLIRLRGVIDALPPDHLKVVRELNKRVNEMHDAYEAALKNVEQKKKAFDEASKAYWDYDRQHNLGGLIAVN